MAEGAHRYHPLLREYLTARSEAAQLRASRVQAASCYAARHQRREAVRLYLAAGGAMSILGLMFLAHAITVLSLLQPLLG